MGYNNHEVYFFYSKRDKMIIEGLKKSRIGGDEVELLKLIRKLSPESIFDIERRYEILRTVNYRQPIGRRSLASELDMGERLVRNEIENLKTLGLLNNNNMGMYVTDEGSRLIVDLDEFYKNLKGIPELTKKLNQKLKLRKILVVPGDSGKDELVLKDMGKAATNYLVKILKDDDIVGVTGGSTMANVSESINTDSKFPNVTVIPARGGLGIDLNTQANSVAAKLGEGLRAKYRLLYIPDSLSEDALTAVLKNQEIKESLEFIKNMSVLLFGIGRADIMANRRNLSKERIKSLLEEGAVAEAFGHYFDISGNEVWEYKTVGITLDNYMKINEIIGVAGGEDKAEAIIALSALRKDITLIIDEAVGNKIINILT